MPTIFSHALAAAAIGRVYTDKQLPGRFWLWTAVLAMLPDADVVGFAFGIRYDDLFGHRGFTHSLFFSALAGAIGAWLYERADAGAARDAVRRLVSLAIFFATVVASHALLDALTDGGRGVALLSPFSNERFFFPWRPIAVSPIGVRFFSPRGVRVIVSELWWIGLPSAAIVLAAAAWRWTRKRAAS